MIMTDRLIQVRITYEHLKAFSIVSKALPYLLTLATYPVLSWHARRSLSHWRALQVYDTQKPAQSRQQSPEENARLLPTCLWIGFFSTLFVVVTAIGKWDGPWFLLNMFRLAVPSLLLSMVLFGSLYLFVVPIVVEKKRALILVGRVVQQSVGKPGMLSISSTAKPRSRGEQNIRCCILLLFCLSVACLSVRMSEFTTLLFCGLAGVFADLLLFSIPPTLCNGQVSFRYHVMAFGIFWGGILAFTVVGFGILFLIISMLATDTVSTPKDDEIPAFLINFLVDLPLKQILCLRYPLSWGSCLFICAWLIGLAYRFDVHCIDEEITLLTETEKMTILKMNEENMESKDVTRDPLGCIPIAITTVENEEISRLNLNAKTTLPTFYSCMVAFIGVHALFLLFIFCLPSTFNRAEFPTSWSDVRMEPNYAVLNYAIFLSWPTLLVAMAVSCLIQGQGTSRLRKLWKYSEQWEVEDSSAEASNVRNAEEIELMTGIDSD